MLAATMIVAAAGAQNYFPAGDFVGYNTYSPTGMASIDCSYSSSSSACNLEAFQATLGSPVAPPIAYGDHLLHISQSYYSYPMTFTDLSATTLENNTANSFVLKDCENIRTVYTSSSSSYGPAVFMAPGSKGGENGSLVPEVKPLQFQYVAFNTSDNYTEPNRTYFRIYDVDASRDYCHAKEVGPSVEEQKKMKLGKGSLRCLARKEVVDNNNTQVVKYTHLALVEHDRNYDGSCSGTSASGYSKSCLRLISMTSYSNGTKGTTTSKDISGFPDSVQFRTDMTPCYYDDNRDSLMVLGTAGSAAVLLRVDSVTSYYSPTVTLARTFDYPQVYPTSSTLMGIDGKFAFVNRQSILAYSSSGDLIINKTLPTMGSSYSSSFTNVAFHRTTKTSATERKAPVKSE